MKVLADIRALADAAAIRGNRELCLYLHAKVSEAEAFARKIEEIDRRVSQIEATRLFYQSIPEMHIDA